MVVAKAEQTVSQSVVCWVGWKVAQKAQKLVVLMAGR